MYYQHHKKNDFTLVYGFKKKTDRFYKMVLTLYPKTKVETWIYGLLSQVRLNDKDLEGLLNYLVDNVITTDYMVIEVLPEHAGVYKYFLPVEKIKKSKTFNDIECEILYINCNVLKGLRDIKKGNVTRTKSLKEFLDDL